MSTPESLVKRKVKALLQAHRCYQFWPVQTGLGAPTLDVLGFHESRGFAVECKAPGKHPTKRQEGTIKDIQSTKTPAFVVDGEESLVALRDWLERKP